MSKGDDCHGGELRVIIMGRTFDRGVLSLSLGALCACSGNQQGKCRYTVLGSLVRSIETEIERALQKGAERTSIRAHIGVGIVFLVGKGIRRDEAVARFAVD